MQSFARKKNLAKISEFTVNADDVLQPCATHIHVALYTRPKFWALFDKDLFRISKYVCAKIVSVHDTPNQMTYAYQSSQTNPDISLLRP